MTGQATEPLARREFKVLPRTIFLVGLILLPITALLPAISLHELISTGTIDWTYRGSGRRALPSWAAYPFGWAFLLWGLYFFVPMLRYIRSPLMFALEPEGIEVQGIRIERNEITSIRPRILQGDVLLESERGKFRIYPGHVAGGVAALKEAFPDRFDPLWLKDSRAWLVGR
ncbi:hypothetical protein [Erythrobacter dokdonensis]|uniref:hypothetical protein n=1 Tax=Erythrobacter dokdonensis TaxID=328225 RepID=UPI00083B5936|nr:hypothetical protein [Erythrobacter dokdonensis]